MKGVDYAWGPKPYDAFKQQGIRFAMRYISHDNSKDLSYAEKRELHKRGIGVGLVFESTANRALSGFANGAVDAKYAAARASLLGMKDVPIYFAVDFDATDRQKPLIREYLRGCASVLGRNRVGVYGGYWVVKDCYEHRACDWFWQTYAWSGGMVHPATHIYQYHNGVRINGLSVDLNMSRKQVFGVQPPPQPVPVPKPKPKPRPKLPPIGQLLLDSRFVLWLQWKTGTGVFAGFGKANPRLRPAVGSKVPASWWGGLKAYLGAKGQS